MAYSLFGQKFWIFDIGQIESSVNNQIQVKAANATKIKK